MNTIPSQWHRSPRACSSRNNIRKYNPGVSGPCRAVATAKAGAGRVLFVPPSQNASARTHRACRFSRNAAPGKRLGHPVTTPPARKRGVPPFPSSTGRVARAEGFPRPSAAALCAGRVIPLPSSRYLTENPAHWRSPSRVACATPFTRREISE